MQKVQQKKSIAWKKCNMKKGSTKKTWKVNEIEKHEKTAIRKIVNMKRVEHEESLTGKKGNMKIVQHEQSIVTEWTFEKSAHKECTRVHKRITGRLLKDLYTGVVLACINVPSETLDTSILKNSH